MSRVASTLFPKARSSKCTMFAKDKLFGGTLGNVLKQAPSRFWKFLSVTKKKEVVFISVGGCQVTDPKEIVVVFNQYFKFVFNVLRQTPGNEASESRSLMGDLRLSQEGIFNPLLNLDIKKAKGPNNIPWAFLRRYAEWSTLPSDWRCTCVVLVLKSGDAQSVCNYRPIFLTFFTCKMLEHIISKHITDQ